MYSEAQTAVDKRWDRGAAFLGRNTRASMQTLCVSAQERRAAVPHLVYGLLRARVEPLSSGDRLFIHSLAGPCIYIHSALIEAGKVIEVNFILATHHGLSGARSFETLDSRPFEYAVFGKGIDMHKLSEEERKCLEKYRDFEF
ncbi:hypothetical protein Y032_0250g159 [Ancylostoma ceylanicum]|uniref:Uncharacterized protein n=1 Tax=Ancylostoma ceylanicum TaxID=53326 RepID=A0A016SCB1_9BILA|nr:hypothetical protein Y032_0250g159 [Ancylostoma ceylanicum]